jgi:hypothetical protein
MAGYTLDSVTLSRLSLNDDVFVIIGPVLSVSRQVSSLVAWEAFTVRLACTAAGRLLCG